MADIAADIEATPPLRCRFRHDAASSLISPCLMLPPLPPLIDADTAADDT